jgi:hypothetical protein
MPLHINLCINLQFVYFIDFVFMLILLGVQPARQSLCIPGGEEMFEANEQFYDSPHECDNNNDQRHLQFPHHTNKPNNINDEVKHLKEISNHVKKPND